VVRPPGRRVSAPSLHRRRYEETPSAQRRASTTASAFPRSAWSDRTGNRSASCASRTPCGWRRSAQKARESRRNQQLTTIKEQKLRPKIDTHDYETKKRNVVRFLEGGNKVKVTIMFRGREQSRPELGFRLLQRLAEDVAELGTVEAAPKQDGRNMTMVIAPNKKPVRPRPAAQAVEAPQI
jgi:translation initiation factor IF-3